MSDSTAPPLSTELNARLSFMMFLQYAIWGAWLPFLWSYLFDGLDFTAGQIGNIFAAGAVGAILGPALAGPIADRFLSTEKLLGISHLAGAALIWQLARFDTYGAFIGFSLVYGFIYMPTLALTNSLAFAHLPDRDRDFGRVRLWGTFGWIVVGLTMGQWLLRVHTPEGADAAGQVAAQVAGKVDAFKLSAILGLAMGIYCFTLPNTPPSQSSESNPALKALKEVRYQPLITLFLLAVPVSCIHQFYFVHTEGFLTAKQVAAPGWMKTVFGAGGGGLMTIGQMSEVVVLGLIPFVAKIVARKWLLAVGLLAYAARMAIFAYTDAIPLPTSAALMVGIAMHGLCFGCFIFVAFMVVDEETTHDVRASAQNLFNLVIVGIGVIVGSKIASAVATWATVPETKALEYDRLFSVPMWASLVCLLALLIFYPTKSPHRGDVESA